MSKFYATIKNGELDFGEHHKLVRDYLNKYSGDVVVDITRKRDIRSNQQNKYYRGLVIVKMAGEGESEYNPWHDRFKLMFVPYVYGIDPLRWEKVKELSDAQLYKYSRAFTTTQFNTVEFEEYLAYCRKFAAKIFDLYIPLPGEAPLEFRYNQEECKTK